MTSSECVCVCVGGGGLEGGGAQGWLTGLVVGCDSFCMPSGLGWQLWPLLAISSGGWGEGDGGRVGRRGWGKVAPTVFVLRRNPGRGGVLASACRCAGIGKLVLQQPPGNASNDRSSLSAVDAMSVYHDSAGSRLTKLQAVCEPRSGSPWTLFSATFASTATSFATPRLLVFLCSVSSASVTSIAF